MGQTTAQRRPQECVGAIGKDFSKKRHRAGLQFRELLLIRLINLLQNLAHNPGTVPTPPQHPCPFRLFHCLCLFKISLQNSGFCDKVNLLFFTNLALQFKQQTNKSLNGDPKSGAFQCVSSCVGLLVFIVSPGTGRVSSGVIWLGSIAKEFFNYSHFPPKQLQLKC